MREKKLSACPVELMLVVVDQNQSQKAVDVISSMGVEYNISFMSTGTAKSEIADLFSFGLIDREIIGCFIARDKIDFVMDTIASTLKFEETNHGIAMSIPVSSASSNLLELLHVEY